MIFDAKFLTLLAFIVINFLIIFIIKTRTSIITALIISYLVIVLFFSLSLSNYNSYQEIVLALIICSMVTLLLISSYRQTDLSDEKPNKTKGWRQFLIFAPVVCLTASLSFFALFLLTKNTFEISKLVAEKKINQQENIINNPMISPNHAVHVAVKKFYLGKKFEDNRSKKTYLDFEFSERKKARLKDKLSDNFLLKRSSEAILIIVVISSVLLILSSKKVENNS
jgi:hypothetical protein